MGMFDKVKRKAVKCPICGGEISDFQSKDGFRRLLTITPQQLVDDAYRLWGDIDVEYYGYCDWHCGAFYFTYNRKTKKWSKKFFTRKELYGEEIQV